MFESFKHGRFICIIVCNVCFDGMVSLAQECSKRNAGHLDLTTERCSRSAFAGAAICLPAGGNVHS